MRAPSPYSHTSARSKPLVVGATLAILAESVALHALVLARSPATSVVLLAANAWTIWRLIRDYRALGRLHTELGDTLLHIRIGRRADCSVPLRSIISVTRLTWRSVPDHALTGYAKLSGFDDPNVLLALDQPIRVALGFGIKKNATSIGLLLEEPDRFVGDLASRPSSDVPGPISTGVA